MVLSLNSNIAGSGMGVMVSSEVWNSKDVCAIFIKVGEQAEFHCSNIEGSSLTCFQLLLLVPLSMKNSRVMLATRGSLLEMWLVVVPKRMVLLLSSMLAGPIKNLFQNAV